MPWITKTTYTPAPRWSFHPSPKRFLLLIAVTFVLAQWPPYSRWYQAHKPLTDVGMALVGFVLMFKRQP